MIWNSSMWLFYTLAFPYISRHSTWHTFWKVPSRETIARFLLRKCGLQRQSCKEFPTPIGLFVPLAMCWSQTISEGLHKEQPTQRGNHCLIALKHMLLCKRLWAHIIKNVNFPSYLMCSLHEIPVLTWQSHLLPSSMLLTTELSHIELSDLEYHLIECQIMMGQILNSSGTPSKSGATKNT